MLQDKEYLRNLFNSVREKFGKFILKTVLSKSGRRNFVKKLLSQ